MQGNEFNSSVMKRREVGSIGDDMTSDTLVSAWRDTTSIANDVGGAL